MSDQEKVEQEIDARVALALANIWSQGYDGKTVVFSFVRVATGVALRERPEDLPELVKLIQKLGGNK